MYLTVKFSVLLMTVVVALLGEAAAAPTKRQTGFFTIPIQPLHGQVPRDIHPQLYLQQHINRADRRLARMTGRAIPSDDELVARLHKRMYIIANPIQPDRPGTQSKRYNSAQKLVQDFKAKAKAQSTNSTAANNATAANDAIAANNATAANDAIAANNATAANNAIAANNATAANNAALGQAAVNGTAASSTNQGVSPIDIQAINSPVLTPANQPTTSNSLGLSIEGPDTGYVGQVSLGTPPRNFQILMDSGSADFWVGSEQCTSLGGGGCGNHQFLGPKSSSTFVDTKAPFNVTYGTGQVAGTIITDDVTMAGLKLPAHTFGTADVESVDFSSNAVKFDGLMGLAQSGLSQQQTLTPVESLQKAGLITAAIASYKISRLADQKNDGELTIGALDTTKFDQATLVTLPNINQQGFWEGNMDAVTVNGKDVGLAGRTSILDTGTSLMLVPPSDATAIHNLIPGAKPDGQGGFTVPCTTTASVALTFGGKSFAIDPRDISPIPVDPNNPAGDCVSGIVSQAVGGAQQWLVGDTFLKNAYFSTNVNANTVSLAKLV